jgi:hypothetical protein
MLIASEGKHGNNSKDRQDEQETQVLNPAPQPLLDLRTSAGLPAQVRRLPFVLPRTGVEGRSTRSFEIELVRKQLANGN